MRPDANTTGRLWIFEMKRSIRKRIPIDYNFVAERLTYDPDTGHLTWKKNGRIAGHKGTYISVRFSRTYMVLGHRIAWLLSYGSLPEDHMVIDHINRDKHDNRLCNLRVISHGDNLLNSNFHEAGGVCYCKQTKRWKAYARRNGRQHWVGRYSTRELARAAIVDLRSKGVIA